MPEPSCDDWRSQAKRLLERRGVALGVLLLLALALRLTNLDFASLWIDEIYSLMVANGHHYPKTLDGVPHSAREYFENYLSWQPTPWTTLLEILHYNVHLPLYYVLLNPWLGWVGVDAWGLRAFSVFFSVAMLVPLYGLGRALGGERMAGWGTLLAAVSPYQIYLAQEGRMYTLTLFWVVTSTLGLWKVLNDEALAKWGALYTVSVLAGTLSHYNFAFVVAFQAFYAATHIVRRPKKRHLFFLVPAAALIVTGALWYPVFQAQNANMAGQSHFSKHQEPWYVMALMLVWQPVKMMAGNSEQAAFFYVPLSLLLLGCLLWQCKQRKARAATYGLLGAWIGGVMLTQAITDVIRETRTITILRYVALISPAVYLGLGSIVASLPTCAWSRLAKLGLLAVSIGGASALVLFPELREEDKSPAKDVHDVLRRRYRRGDLIVANGPLGAPALLAFELRSRLPKAPILHFTKSYGGTQELPLPKPKVFARYKRVWLFEYHTNSERGIREIEEFLSKRYAEPTLPLQRSYIDGNSRLLLYRTPAWTTSPGSDRSTRRTRDQGVVRNESVHAAPVPVTRR